MARKKGEGTWGTKTVKGITYERFVGTYNGVRKEFTGRTKAEVKEKIRAFEDSNMFISKKETKKMTFGDYASNWLENVKAKTVEKSTLRNNREIIDYKLKPHQLYNTQIGNLSDKICQDFVDYIESKYAKSTIDHTINFISQCMNYAVKREDIAKNYMKDTVRAKESNLSVQSKTIEFLQADDILLLTKEMDRLNTNEYRINGAIGTRVYGVNAYYIVLILYTGMRVSELLALTWEDVDFENKVLSINKALGKYVDIDNNNKVMRYNKSTKTKNGAREVPLNDIAIYCLQRIKELNLYESSADRIVNNIVSESNLGKTLRAMIKRSGCNVNNFGLHALRHSYGSMLIENDINIKTVSYLLGHKDISTTMNIYIHVTEKMKDKSRSVVNLFNEKYSLDYNNME